MRTPPFKSADGNRVVACSLGKLRLGQAYSLTQAFDPFAKPLCCRTHANPKQIQMLAFSWQLKKINK